MKSFQIVVIAIFVFFIIVGVITFATFRGDNTESREQVAIWGSVDQLDFLDVVTKINLELSDRIQVDYRQIRGEDFDGELIEALASGVGPDLILLPQDLIVRHEDKITPIPFESFPERDFRDSFIEEGELYLTDNGALGLPFSIDPLIMYWNRTLFSNEGIASPPEYWDEMFDASQRLSKIDERNNILQSAVALGTYGNINNAKELLALMMIQAGNPITIRDRDGNIDSLLDQKLGFPEPPAISGLRFYTEFADSAKNIYSWGPSQPEALQEFLSGGLAMYFGFASELSEIQIKNPNLNFDVAPMPQVRGSASESTFGKMYALAVMKSSQKATSAFKVLGILTSASALGLWEEVTTLPPARRSLLRPDLNPSKPTAIDAYRSVFHDMALVSTAFLDPNREVTGEIFRDMVDSVISGRDRISDAIDTADDRINELDRQR